MSNIEEVLGKTGSLSQAIAGFTPRESQQKMAEAIERTLKLDAQLIVEAGTGTGKTFGYLVPLFLSQKKTIISTGTKNLQDQLFYKDIPIIKKIFSSLRRCIQCVFHHTLSNDRITFLTESCPSKEQKNFCECDCILVQIIFGFPVAVEDA